MASLRPSWTTVGLSSLAPPLVVVLVALFMQLVVPMFVGSFPIKLGMDVGIAVILAVSLNFVNGFTGQFSIGHAGFMSVGGYAAGVLTYYGGARLFSDTVAHGDLAGQALFGISIIAGGLVAAALGWVVGLPSLRLKGDYLALVTLGFGEIVRVLLQRSGDVLYDTGEIAKTPWIQPLGLWRMVVPGTPPSPGTAEAIEAEAQQRMLVTSLGGADGFMLPDYATPFWVWLFVGITLLVAYRLKESNHGRAYLSVREDEIAAEAMGIPTTAIKVRSFVIAAFFAGVAGGLYAHLGGTLAAKELGFQKSFEIVIMVVLGGMGSISGCTLAAIILTLLPELLRDFESYRMIVYAITLVVVMLVRPEGLFGLREIWELGPFRRLVQK